MITFHDRTVCVTPDTIHLRRSKARPKRSDSPARSHNLAVLGQFIRPAETTDALGLGVFRRSCFNAVGAMHDTFLITVR